MVCHIWPGTTYDERYHTLLANLVLIPRILANLSDYFNAVIDVLKYRSYELYGWYPEELRHHGVHHIIRKSGVSLWMMNAPE